MKKKEYCLMMLLAVTLLFFCPLSSTMAQGGYPTRPIDVIIPGEAGSTIDLVVRFFAEKWAEFLGQPVIALNKPGGNMTIGTKLAALAKPDGYTLYNGVDTSLIVGRLGRKNMGYDLDSFRPFFQYTSTVMYYTVRADSKWKTLKEFLSDAKQNPGKLICASYGIGVVTHFATEMLSQAAGVKLTWVPFKGSVGALAAVIGGNADIAVTNGLAGMTGSPIIRPLAIAQEERLFDNPDIPTLKDLGYPIFMNTIQVLCGPRGTSDEIVNKFVDAHLKVSAKYGKEIKEKLPKLDLYPTSSFIDGNSAMKILKEREKKYKEIAPLVGIKEE